MLTRISRSNAWANLAQCPRKDANADERIDLRLMELNEMQQLKQLEDENRRLKQIVAEQTFHIRR